MKSFILASLIISNVSFAFDCNEVLEGKEIWQIEDDTTTFKKERSKNISFPHKQMRELGIEASLEDCKTINHEVYKFLPTGETFNVFATYDDSCDGGNSFGYIMDSNDKYIATIGDSVIACLRRD